VCDAVTARRVGECRCEPVARTNRMRTDSHLFHDIVVDAHLFHDVTTRNDGYMFMCAFTPGAGVGAGVERAWDRVAQRVIGI
jgi:hypothetical protein